MLRVYFISALVLAAFTLDVEGGRSIVDTFPARSGRKLLSEEVTCASGFDLYVEPAESSGTNCLLTGFPGWQNTNQGAPVPGPLFISIPSGSECIIRFNPLNRDGAFEVQRLNDPFGFLLAPCNDSDPTCDNTMDKMGSTNIGAFANSSLPVGLMAHRRDNYWKGGLINGNVDARILRKCSVDIFFTIVESNIPETPALKPVVVPKTLTTVETLFKIGTGPRDGLDPASCPQRPNAATNITIVTKIGEQNVSTINATGPWADGSTQDLSQNLFFSMPSDLSVPIEPIITIDAIGYDQLKASLQIKLTYQDNSTTLLCYPNVEVGFYSYQCPLDCTQCQSTTLGKQLMAYPNGIKQGGDCAGVFFS